MEKNANISNILTRLRLYKRKYYINELIKGLLILFALLSLSILTINSIEYLLRLNSTLRFALLLVFILFSFYTLTRYLIIPALHLVFLNKYLTDEDAAKKIGQNFGNINDKLLNIIQLNNSVDVNNTLAIASINQKANIFKDTSFESAISIKNSNKKYILPFIAAFGLLMLVISLFPGFIKEPSYRLLHFQESFTPLAPFQFYLKNQEMTIFKGEDFKLQASIQGDKLPQTLFVYKNGIKYQMQKTQGGHYNFIFSALNQNTTFYLEAEGYTSKRYQINVLEKPLITDMIVDAKYPTYLQLGNERFPNLTNITVPVGTKLQWNINTKATDKLFFIEKDSLASEIEKTASNSFVFDKEIIKTFNYQLNTVNNSKGSVLTDEYTINAIPDSYPKITIDYRVDSSLYTTLAINGNLEDDYGFTALKIYYQIGNTQENNKTYSNNISIVKNTNNQQFFHLWRYDSLLKDGEDEITFYLKVWDNDGINGPKSVKTRNFRINIPSNKEVNATIDKNSKTTDNQLVKSVETLKEVENELEKVNELLKVKNKLSFEDKNRIKDVLEQSEELNSQLQEIEKRIKENANKREKFNQPNKNLREKSEQLANLMNEVKKDELTELLEKIKDLMEKTNESESIKKEVEQYQEKERNRLKQMQRLMQLYKRLEIEYDLSQVKKELEGLTEDQKQLADKENQGSENEEIEQQKKLNQDFEDIKKSLEETKDKNRQLDQPNQIKETQDIENEIDQSQQESLEKLKENKKSEAKNKQQKAAEKMKKMAELLSAMQEGMQGEQVQENIDDLRDVVDNLLKLSFKQESLMKALREIDANDPRFLKVSESQLALKDDAKIVDDSLTSIANRVFQLRSLILTEVTALNSAIEKSIEALQIREDNKANAYQQMVMESSNELAILLDAVIQQMQMQMKSQGKGSSSNEQEPSLGELQKSLNQKTQKLSESQKEGRQYKEGLAETAAEQARIRRMVEKMKKEGFGKEEKGGGAGSLSNIMEEMEKIEEGLVNEELTEKLIERQQNILTRLLESDKAEKKQEEDDERKGETANNYQKEKIPDAFEKYLKARKKEVEQIKSLPPNFSSYYQNELNKYYNRIKSNN